MVWREGWRVFIGHFLMIFLCFFFLEKIAKKEASIHYWFRQQKVPLFPVLLLFSALCLKVLLCLICFIISRYVVSHNTGRVKGERST